MAAVDGGRDSWRRPEHPKPAPPAPKPYPSSSSFGTSSDEWNAALWKSRYVSLRERRSIRLAYFAMGLIVGSMGMLGLVLFAVYG